MEFQQSVDDRENLSLRYNIGQISQYFNEFWTLNIEILTEVRNNGNIAGFVVCFEFFLSNFKNHFCKMKLGVFWFLSVPFTENIFF